MPCGSRDMQDVVEISSYANYVQTSHERPLSGTLYVVATPIGNLEDVSPRVRQTLAQVDIIVAEDTRHTRRLLSHFGIKTPQKALHEHNEERVVPDIIESLKNGDSVALVSDAGTPLVSDPGFRLVRSAHVAGVPVSPVPGPSAVTAALSAAGLPVDRFCFQGFLPAKPVARRAMLEALATGPRTMVFFESVHRIRDCVDDMVQAFGSERRAFIGRELTKLNEQCITASLPELRAGIMDGSIVSKGEFVVVVEGGNAQPGSALDTDRLLSELVKEMPGKRAAALAARVTGRRRNELYRRILELGC